MTGQGKRSAVYSDYQQGILTGVALPPWHNMISAENRFKTGQNPEAIFENLNQRLP